MDVFSEAFAMIPQGGMKSKGEKKKGKSEFIEEKKEKSQGKKRKWGEFKNKMPKKSKKNNSFVSTMDGEYDAAKIYQVHHSEKMSKEEQTKATEINRTRNKLLLLVSSGKIIYPVNTRKDSLHRFLDICKLPFPWEKKEQKEGKKSSLSSSQESSSSSQDSSTVPRQGGYGGTAGPPIGYAFIISKEEGAIIPFFDGIPFVHVMPLNPSDYLHVIDQWPIHATERKSSDLAKGINNGSYHDQTQRMKGLPLLRFQIGLLQEQPKKGFKHDKDIGTLRACQSSKIFRDGFFWRRSDGILDTVLMFYKDMLAILEKGCFYYDNYVLRTPANEDEQVLKDLSFKRTKGGRPKDNITPAKAWQMYIGSFPNIGPKLASAVTSQYPNFPSLLAAYGTCKDDEEKQGLLQDLRCTEISDKRTTIKAKEKANPKKRRKLGLEASKTIFEYTIGGPAVPL